MDRPYHHGNLRAALLAAAEALLDELGMEAFSLREVARRAGVSPGAPKHHFMDVKGLLTAVATRSFEELAGRLEQANGPGRSDLATMIARQGEAYVRFALAQPARFDLMWRVALLDMADPAYQRAGTRAFQALDHLVRGADAPVLPKHDPALATTVACWSIVHGFARLARDGSFGPTPQEQSQALATLLPVVMSHLRLD